MQEMTLPELADGLLGMMRKACSGDGAKAEFTALTDEQAFKLVTACCLMSTCLKKAHPVVYQISDGLVQSIISGDVDPDDVEKFMANS